MKHGLSILCLLLLFNSCDQLNKKQETPTPKKVEKDEFDKLFEQATPVFDSAHWARQESLRAEELAKENDTNSYYRTDLYQKIHQKVLTDDLSIDDRRFICDSVLEQSRTLSDQGWSMMDSILQALPKTHKNRLFFEALRADHLGVTHRAGPKGILYGLYRFSPDSIASSTSLSTYELSEGNEWEAVMSPEAKWFAELKDSLYPEEQEYQVEKVVDYSLVLGRLAKSEKLSFESISPKGKTLNKFAGLYQYWNECEESSRYLIRNQKESSEAILGSKYSIELEFTSDSSLDTQIQQQFWYMDECADCLTNFRDQVVFAKFKDVPVVATYFGQRYIASQGKTGKPYTFNRTLFLIGPNGKLYPLWTASYDNFFCSCL